MFNFKALQEYGYNVLMSGYNVFLTGDAGTGKTYLLRMFINEQRKLGRNIMVCGPTGAASLHINGSTLHHQFKAKVGPIVKHPIDSRVLLELIDTDILVIDEISMCRVDLFDYIITYILEANKYRKRANKHIIQFVISGDFFQLPPIISDNDKEVLDAYYQCDIGNGFAFNSKYWKLFDFKNIILTEIVRQESKEFITELNKIRVGDKSGIDYIMNNCSKAPIPDAINLYGKNNDAIEKNISELNKLDSDLWTHEAIVLGAAKITDTNAEMNLALKVGARVMSLVNNIDKESNQFIYSNGSLGTVVFIGDNYVTVEFDNGNIVNIEIYKWDIFRYSIDEKTKNNPLPKLIEEKIGEVYQYPLKLAYAVTIHKAQGQTYDSVNISPYTWDCGQLYVALSRVRNIDNLYLRYDIQPNYSVTSLRVIEFYNSIVHNANKDVDTTIDLIGNKKIDFQDSDMNKIFGLLGGNR